MLPVAHRRPAGLGPEQRAPGIRSGVVLLVGARRRRRAARARTARRNRVRPGQRHRRRGRARRARDAAAGKPGEKTARRVAARRSRRVEAVRYLAVEIDAADAPSGRQQRLRPTPRPPTPAPNTATGWARRGRRRISGATREHGRLLVCQRSSAGRPEADERKNGRYRSQKRCDDLGLRPALASSETWWVNRRHQKYPAPFAVAAGGWLPLNIAHLDDDGRRPPRRTLPPTMISVSGCCTMKAIKP